jgi:hypothetical protein
MMCQSLSMITGFMLLLFWCIWQPNWITWIWIYKAKSIRSASAQPFQDFTGHPLLLENSTSKAATLHFSTLSNHVTHDYSALLINCAQWIKISIRDFKNLSNIFMQYKWLESETLYQITNTILYNICDWQVRNITDFIIISYWYYKMPCTKIMQFCNFLGYGNANMFPAHTVD